MNIVVAAGEMSSSFVDFGAIYQDIQRTEALCCGPDVKTVASLSSDNSDELCFAPNLGTALSFVYVCVRESVTNTVAIQRDGTSSRETQGPVCEAKSHFDLLA